MKHEKSTHDQQMAEYATMRALFAAHGYGALPIPCNRCGCLRSKMNL